MSKGYTTFSTDTVSAYAQKMAQYRHSTVQYSTVQYNTVQYSTVQYSTVQYSTVQCSTVQTWQSARKCLHDITILLLLNQVC